MCIKYSVPAPNTVSAWAHLHGVRGTRRGGGEDFGKLSVVPNFLNAEKFAFFSGAPYAKEFPILAYAGFRVWANHERWTGEFDWRVFPEVQ